MRVLGLMLLAGCGATALQVPEDALTLARVKRSVGEQLQVTRNFTCLQTIERWRRSNSAGRFELSDVVRFEIALVNGKESWSWPGGVGFTIEHPSEVLAGGMSGSGEFSAFARSIFLNYAATLSLEDVSGDQFAIRYRLPMFASGFTVGRGGRSAVVGSSGVALVDRAMLRLLSVAVTADVIPAELGLADVTARIAYEPMKLDGAEVVLPSAAETTMTLFSGEQNRNRVTFSHCREYKAESTIRLGNDAPAAPAGSAGGSIEPLPAGVLIRTALATRIDTATAAVGDLVETVLEQDVKRGKQVLLAEGARVMGRVRRLERARSTIPYVAIALELSSAGEDGRQMPVHAELRYVELRPGMHRRIPGSRQRISTTQLLHTAQLESLESETFHDKSLLNLVSFFIEGEKPVLEPGLSIVWRTVDPAAGSRPRPVSLEPAFRPETDLRVWPF
jgi:hypothetical protein